MKKIMLAVIRIYQKYISRYLLLGNNCRFTPNCSAYTYEAVLKYGTIKGLLLGAKRLLHCYPCFKGGNDPLR